MTMCGTILRDGRVEGLTSLCAFSRNGRFLGHAARRSLQVWRTSRRVCLLMGLVRWELQPAS